MRIKRVEVHNYKSFRKLVVSDLSNINMIYGYNNSGKSNVLKFLELLFSVKENPEISATGGSLTFWKGIIKDHPFIFHNNAFQNDISFKVSIEIPNNELKGLFDDQEYALLKKHYMKSNHNYATLVLNGNIEYLDFYQSEIILSEVIFNSLEIYNYTNSGQYFSSAPAKSIIRTNGYAFFNRIMGLLNNCVLILDNNRYFKKEAVSDSFDINSINSRNLKNSLFQISLLPEYSSIYKELLNFISSFEVSERLNKQFKDCEVNSPLKNVELSFSKYKNEIDIILANQLGKQLPLKNFGTGIQQIFYILSKIFFTNSKILFVEELELNLSPKYQKILLANLYRLINTGKISQVVFTTHSKYFTFRNDLRLYEVSIDNVGISSVKKVKAVSKSFFEYTDLE